ncbi:MAG: DUF4843 domain-containing protein [Bacteroides sp.]|nr:DUF4843 domain-containing protein [Bacteroides sp.]
MKHLYLYIGVLAVVVFSCSQDIDMPYTEESKIYFEYEYQDPNWSSVHLVARDSVTAAMGKLSNDQTQMEVKIPMKLLGEQLSEDKTYKIEIVPEGTVIKGKTTAVANQHYVPLADKYVFHAGVWVDTLRITALRSALSTSYADKETRTLVLRISDEGELKKGLRDGWEMLVSLSNYIAEPTWWTVYGLGFYHPEKYKILLMFRDEDFYATADLLNDSAGKQCVKALKNYLRDNVVIDEVTGKRVTFDALVDIEDNE